jgi:hypothetical protein
MRGNLLGMCSAVATVAVAGSAGASVVSFEVNWGPNGPSQQLVGIAVKVDNGPASVQSITDGTTYNLPTGWSQQTLMSTFAAGTNPSATPSQYGFVRGAGGSTFSTASTYGGSQPNPLGFTATLALDPSTPAEGAQINVLWTTFVNDGTVSAQGGINFTYTEGAWVRGTFSGPQYPWSQADSGTFNQLSAAVVPAPGAVALLGAAGLMARRRRN